ncbi:hypothetical protein [Maritimibacter alkaliphilus]|uniref:hypothetical protein n=1 Tax=Maritimibacter alkaliphilus TaxID=404236 RepID=UPI001C98499B|nr:hypothetical protein [Maritimibacter alkaliphilus]MBY6092517.1 hypothetical protein [Maritimibacter alkaliphilus]
MNIKKMPRLASLLICTTSLGASAAYADFFTTDVEIKGSLCVGFDCTDSETYGFDTIKLKENNLRILFDDTSASGSFPANDWRLVANGSNNGDPNYFAIEDATAGRNIVYVESGSPANTLRVDSAGRIGIQQANPAVLLHVTDGNTPTLRLDQDGSDGFASQIWDVAGNESNFFVRDVTNASRLPFRIAPGAPTDAIYIAANGNVGIGKAGAPTELFLQGDGTKARFRFSTGDATEDDFLLNWKDEVFRMSFVSTPVVEFTLNNQGDLDISGSLTTGTAGSCTSATPCDAVFDPDVYDVPSINSHAEQMWANKFLPAVGPTTSDKPLNVTTKLLSMLNELEHAHIYIEQLHKRLERLEEVQANDKG